MNKSYLLPFTLIISLSVSGYAENQNYKQPDFSLSAQLGANIHVYDENTSKILSPLTIGPNIDIKLYSRDFFISFKGAVTTVTTRDNIQTRGTTYPKNKELNTVDFGYFIGYRLRNLLSFIPVEYFNYIDVETSVGLIKSSFVVPSVVQDKLKESYQFNTTSGIALGSSLVLPIFKYHYFDSEIARADIVLSFFYSYSDLGIIDPVLGSNSFLIQVNFKGDLF